MNARVTSSRTTKHRQSGREKIQVKAFAETWCKILVSFADRDKNKKDRKEEKTMRKNTVIAVVAAVTMTTAAGVGIGGYMMGRNTAKGTVAVEATANGTVAEAANVVVNTNTNSNTNTTAATTPAAAGTTAETKTAAAPRQFTVTPADYTVYCAVPDLNVRTAPDAGNSTVVGCVKQGQALHVTGEVVEYTWLQVDFNGKVCYVSSPYVQKTAPGTETKEESKESATAETLVVSLDGVNYAKENVTAGMTVADAKDALLYVGGVDVDKNVCEMQVVKVSFCKCNLDGTSQEMTDDQVLEAGNAYYTQITVAAKENTGKTVHFANELALSQDLARNFRIESIGTDSVTLASHFHTV